MPARVLADRWNVRPAAIRYMIRAGLLPAVKIGKRFLLRVEDVERVLAESAYPRRKVAEVPPASASMPGPARSAGGRSRA
jgi:hypothetical protein